VPKQGKTTPYGVYDLTGNEGWVSVGTDHDTAEFAVQTIRCWWRQMGSIAYPEARELPIMADGGGSNGSRTRLWKVALQRFADETGIAVSVCHFPPGTSKGDSQYIVEIAMKLSDSPGALADYLDALVMASTYNMRRSSCQLCPTSGRN
jgi:hypothetical protein